MNRASLILLSLAALATPPAAAQLAINVSPDGIAHLSRVSSIGQEYWLERSFDLRTWSRRGDITASSGAPLAWNDAPGAGTAFYRTASFPLTAHRLAGIDFSPYLDGQNPNLRTSISRAQIEQRMRVLIPYADWVRTFSMVDGLQVSGQVAHQLGFKAALGAWLGPEGTAAGQQANQENIANLIAAGQAGEADLLIVGSEVLQRGDLSASALAAYLAQVKAAVPGVPVTTGDVYGRLIAPSNSQIVSACDLLLVNIYPFWEGTSIDDALTSLHHNYLSSRAVAGSKPVWISETGWPSAGQTVIAAVPTPANAALYFQRFVSWARHLGVPFFYFAGFDESWKTAEGAVGPHWGVFDKDAVLKPGMQPAFDNLEYPANWNAVIGGAGTPSIAFTTIPPTGSTDTSVAGTVSHVAPFDVFISLYIKVAGQWYLKPYANQPWTAASTSGAWTSLFATGGSDLSATHFAAFLFPMGYTPPAVFGASSLPAGLTANALASTVVPRP